MPSQFTSTNTQQFSINPTETIIEVEIGGEKHTLYFNLNAFSKFEEASSLDENGKRLKFPKFLFRLLDAWAGLRSRGVAEATNTDNQHALLDAIGEIGAADIHALLYGALHVYDRDDRPSWPLSPGRLGRILGPMELVRLLPQIMTGLQANLPQAGDTPKGGEEADRPMAAAAAPKVSTPVNGGSTSGALDDGPLALLTVRSDG